MEKGDLQIKLKGMDVKTFYNVERVGYNDKIYLVIEQISGLLTMYKHEQIEFIEFMTK